MDYLYLVANQRTDLQIASEDRRLDRLFESVVDYVVANFKSDTKNVFAGSVAYLRLAGLLVSGWQMARALIVAEQKLADDSEFFSAKIATARFYAEYLLSQVPGVAASVLEGGVAVNSLTAEQF